MATNNGSQNYAVTVGTSAVQLVTQDKLSNGETSPRRVLVQNVHASNDLYVGWGETGATTSVGIRVVAGAHIEADLHPTDEIWGIASGASTGVRVSVLHGRGDPS